MSSICARSARFDLKEPIDPVESHSPIIADDTAAPVSIGKAGDDPGPSAIHDFRRIGVEHAVIVRFPIFRESLVHSRIRLEARCLQAGLDHAQAAEREDRPLEGLVGLKTYDDFVVAIDIAGLMGQQGRGSFCIDRQHPFFLSSAKYGCSLAQTAFVRCDGPRESPHSRCKA